MAPKTLTVKELTDAKAEFISLVPRSASRIPFRVLKEDKSEKAMFDLSSIGKIFKGDKAAPSGPEVVAYGVDGTSLLDQKIQALKSAGVDVENRIDNDDGSVMFVQKQFSADEVVPVRLSDNLVAVVKGFNPYPSGGTFQETLSANGFCSDLATAVDTVRGMILETAYTTSSDRGELIAKSEGLLRDFSEYVVALIKALPEIAFKADKAVTDAVVAKAADSNIDEDETEKNKDLEKSPKKPDKKAEDGEDDDDDDDDDAPEGVDAETWETMSEEERKQWKKDRAEAVAKETEAKEKEKEPVDKSEKTLDTEGLLALVSKAVSDSVSAAVGAINSSIEAVTAKVDGIAGELKEVQGKVSKTEQALGTVVAAPAPTGDHEPSKTIKKSCGELIGSGKVWDSAFQRNV